MFIAPIQIYIPQKLAIYMQNIRPIDTLHKNCPFLGNMSKSVIVIFMNIPWLPTLASQKLWNDKDKTFTKRVAHLIINMHQIWFLKVSKKVL